MKLQDTATLAGIGIVIWLLWKAKEKFSEGTGQVADWIAQAWMTFDDLLPGQGGIQLVGNVVFPNGIYVPLQNLSNARAVKSDPDGNVYANYSGQFWQLSPSDASGNWHAAPVS